MEKMQILFPEPQLSKLRRAAKRRDRPVSELVRTAVDQYLERLSDGSEEIGEAVPTYSCGRILKDPGALREAAYDEEL